MDTKDKNPEPTSPGIVSPDTALGPAMFEMSSGGAAATAPPDEVNVPEGKEEPRKSSTPFQDSLRQLRRDKRAMVSLGMLVSLSVAAMVEIVDIVLGVTVGVLAGFYGGWIDQFLARFTDLMFAFPA